MAITITSTWERVNGSKEFKASNTTSKWSAQRIFQAVCDPISVDNAIAVLNHADIPALGDGYSETYPYLTCRRVRVMDPKGGKLFNVLAEYSGEDSAILDPWKYSIRGSKSLEEVSYDAMGKAYVNALGHPLIGIKRPFYDLAINLTRNEASATFAQSTTYRGSVNSAIVTINGVAYAAGTCLLEDISGDNVPDAFAPYWPITYAIMIRADGWKRKELNKGNYYWDGTYVSGGYKRLVAARTTDGGQYRTVRLALDGSKLADDADDVYLEFDDAKIANWGPLALA